MDVPAFRFSLEAGPATASLEFLAGSVAGAPQTVAALHDEPRRVDLGDRTAETWVIINKISSSRVVFIYEAERRSYMQCVRNTMETANGSGK